MISTRAAISASVSRKAVSLSPHLWALWIAGAAVALAATKADPDLWGHLRFGLDWWRDGTLASVDPYSFTQDRPWVNHEWLSEAAMAAAYLAAGVPGLALHKVMIAGAALGVLARRLRGSAPLIAAGVLALAVGFALPITLTVRPQLWSLLALMILVALMDVSRPPDARRIAGSAALFALWANLHGGWITGVAVLCVYAFVRVLRTRQDIARWSAFVTASVLATLLNPYGLGLWRFLATTVRPERPDITEWQPLGTAAPIVFWIPLVVTIVLAIALSRRRETRPSPEVWAVLILLVLGSLRVMRVAPLMGPTALALLAPSLRSRRVPFRDFTVPTRGAAVVFLAPVLIAAFAVVTITARAVTCFPVKADWAPDLEGAARLAGASGRLLTTFNWGQYAIWHFGPGLRVSIDGRRETVYSDAVLEWHRAFERGDASGQAVVARLAPDYVWLPAHAHEARKWLQANGYRMEYEGEASFVAARNDRPMLTRSASPMPECFP
jgi:hypothetical protein